MIYQIADWAATYVECLVLFAAIAQISGKRATGIKHILLLCFSALTDCILVAILNSIQSFSFLTPVVSIVLCVFVSAVLAKGKPALRATACIIALFVILAIGYIWMIFVCILHGGRFEDAFLDFMTPGPLRCLYLVLDKSTDIAIYLIFRTRLHRLSTLKNRWLVSLLVGSAFAYGVTQYLMNAILSHNVYTMRQVSIVSFLVLLLFFLVFSLLLLTISSRDQERAQRLVLQQTDRLMEKNYQTLHQDLQENAKRIHDFHHHLQAILGLAEQAGDQKTEEYVQSLLDVSYYKPSISAGEWISTVAHYKETTSEVYVAPDNSPSGYSQMRTYCYVSGVPTNKTTAGTVRLADGRKYAINNYVYEDGDYTSNEGVRMYLRMSPTSGSGMMDGHWSPDYAYESGVTYV